MFCVMARGQKGIEVQTDLTARQGNPGCPVGTRISGSGGGSAILAILGLHALVSHEDASVCPTVLPGPAGEDEAAMMRSLQWHGEARIDRLDHA